MGGAGLDALQPAIAEHSHHKRHDARAVRRAQRPHGGDGRGQVHTRRRAAPGARREGGPLHRQAGREARDGRGPLPGRRIGAARQAGGIRLRQEPDPPGRRTDRPGDHKGADGRTGRSAYPAIDPRSAFQAGPAGLPGCPGRNPGDRVRGQGVLQEARSDRSENGRTGVGDRSFGLPSRTPRTRGLHPRKPVAFARGVPRSVRAQAPC